MTERRTYPRLDTMRAVAAVAVVCTHTAFWSGTYSEQWWGSAAQRLEVGVAVFFVLSGFLLGRPYIRSAVLGESTDSVGRYFTKRALRILPVYWVVVVSAFVLVGDNHDLSPARWLQNLLLIDYFRAERLPEGLTQMWSLSIEVSFYLVLPLLGWLLVSIARRARHAPRVLVTSILILTVLSVAYTWLTHGSTHDWATWATRWLPAYLTWFCLGLLLAVADTEASASRRTRISAALLTMARDRLTCWICAAAIFTVVATPLGGSPFLVAPTASEALVRHLGYALVAALVVLPEALGPDQGRVAGWMAHPLARHVGHISYSLFCCHVIVLYLVVPGLGFTLFDSSWFLLTVVVLAISLAVSELLYRYVETPFLRLKPGSRSQSTTTTDRPSSTAH